MKTHKCMFGITKYLRCLVIFLWIFNDYGICTLRSKIVPNVSLITEDFFCLISFIWIDFPHIVCHDLCHFASKPHSFASCSADAKPFATPWLSKHHKRLRMWMDQIVFCFQATMFIGCSVSPGQNVVFDSDLQRLKWWWIKLTEIKSWTQLR